MAPDQLETKGNNYLKSFDPCSKAKGTYVYYT